MPERAPRLDRNRVHYSVHGMHGVLWEQDGAYFAADGTPVTLQPCEPGLQLKLLQEDEPVSRGQPISASEVAAWFKEDAPCPKWRQPNQDSLEGYCELLERFRSERDAAAAELVAVARENADVAAERAAAGKSRIVAFQAVPLADQMPRIRKAAQLLAQELPRIIELGRKNVIATRGKELSCSQLAALESLRAAATAAEDALSAPLFQFKKKQGDNRSDWQPTARLFGNEAKAILEKAGNPTVSRGLSNESPVVKLTQRALGYIGITATEYAIRAALSRPEC